MKIFYCGVNRNHCVCTKLNATSRFSEVSSEISERLTCSDQPLALRLFLHRYYFVWFSPTFSLACSGPLLAI
jgi:hypothetical protein